MSEMMAFKDHKGVELGRLVESITSLASPSKMTEEKPLDEVDEIANRVALAST